MQILLSLFKAGAVAAENLVSVLAPMRWGTISASSKTWIAVTLTRIRSGIFFVNSYENPILWCPVIPQ